MDQDNPTAFEDIGYIGRPDVKQPEDYHMQRKRVKESKRIRYIAGCDKGIERNINAAVADDLIERGYAVCIDREPGCDDE